MVLIFIIRAKARIPIVMMPYVILQAVVRIREIIVLGLIYRWCSNVVPEAPASKSYPTDQGEN